MADFFKWGVACEGADWCSAGEFVRAYESKRAGAVTTVLESEVRRRLAELVFPEAIEVETERVLRCLYEGREARR